jgi:YggT family protein
MTYNQVRRDAEVTVDEKERAVAAANQNSAVARVVNITYFVFGVLDVLLAIRFVLHAFGANASNAFANLIYGVTQPFVALFSTLFNNPVLGEGAVLELTTIAAILVYAFVAWLIGRLLWLTLSRPR